MCRVDYSKPWQVFSPGLEMQLVACITRLADIFFCLLESGALFENPSNVGRERKGLCRKERMCPSLGKKERKRATEHHIKSYIKLNTQTNDSSCESKCVCLGCVELFSSSRPKETWVQHMAHAACWLPQERQVMCCQNYDFE